VLNPSLDLRLVCVSEALLYMEHNILCLTHDECTLNEISLFKSCNILKNIEYVSLKLRS
jgi:hypothetical protein